MKATKSTSRPPGLTARLAVITTMVLCLLACCGASAQQKHSTQVKVFDQEMRPIRNIEVSLNGRAPISTGSKGFAFTELESDDLPIRTVAVKNDEQMEAASWNYSKGVLEIIVRKKNYHVIQLTLKDISNNLMSGQRVTFNGRKIISATTNSEGRFEIPLALDETINSPDQFSVAGYRIVSIESAGDENTLVIDLPEPEADPAGEVVSAGTTPEFFQDFDLSKLDSIRSLTVFYAIFKNYSINELNPQTRKRVDAKFQQLVQELQNTNVSTQASFIGKISDTTFVTEDIRNLLTQATMESQTLDVQRADFDTNIQIIKEKLDAGIGTLDAGTRNKLLSDLALLEKMLSENESRFYRNQNDYRQIINSIREKYFNFENLETMLSESEKKRQEEQQVFTRRLLTISGIMIVFAILIVLLITFSNKLKRQKKELQSANAEIQRINENLEAMVYQRTRLLEEANRELDTFLYRASHDLRSPLCSIVGLCNIGEYLSHKELIERVEKTTIGMDKLLQKLSMISEINQPKEYSQVTVSQIAENASRRFQHMIRSSEIQFHIDCPPDLIFYSNSNLAEVILTNLIENAIFFSSLKASGHARVEVKVEIKTDHLAISVYDNGVGIESAIRPRLYDMFYKGHEKSKGNGLGLYIVQKSVRALEGRIIMESEPDRYTKFVVELPLNSVGTSSKELEYA